MSVAEALNHITACHDSTKSSPWKLDRTKVLDRLEELVFDPNLIEQDGLNLCGPAAFLRVWLARNPLAVAKFACELYDNGRSSIGNYDVEPGSDSLIAEDYNQIKANNGNILAPEADWMIMGSLRDAENAWFDYEGKPDESVAASTTSGEIAEWLEATGLYANVKDEGNFFLTKGIDHARALMPSPSCDVILLINAHILDQMNVTSGTKKSSEFILSAFPNHFVILMSEIRDADPDTLQLTVWTWSSIVSGTINKATFEANYYGAIIGEGAAT